VCERESYRRRSTSRQEMPNLEERTSTRAFSILSYISNGVFMFDLLLLFRCFPEVGRGRFGPFLCHFHLLALALLPSGWGLASDSATIACLELLW
jgi:hypothetical protein